MRDQRNSIELRQNKGFTLVELLVSMTIFLMVSATVYAVLNAGVIGRNTVNQQVPVNKNLRFSLNMLGRDSYNAGFGYPLRTAVVLPNNRVTNLFNLPVDWNTTRDTVPPILVGNNTRTNTLNPLPSARTDQITMLFKDDSFNQVGGVSEPLSINAATTVSGIDTIVPISGSNIQCRVNDLYLVIGNTGATLGVATGLSGSDKVQFANGDLLGLNLAGTTGPLRNITLPASMVRVTMVSYFVTPDGVLTKRTYGNTSPSPSVAWVDEPLVYNVSDLQITYIMDSGVVQDNPHAGADQILGNADDQTADLSAIRQIVYTITVQSGEVGADNKPMKMTMSSTFSTRNLGYDNR